MKSVYELHYAGQTWLFLTYRCACASVQRTQKEPIRIEANGTAFWTISIAKYGQIARIRKLPVRGSVIKLESADAEA